MTYTSCNSLNVLSIDRSPTEQAPFSRDGFGRQSMSEKRHGHVDPRVSEFYRKLKESRGQVYHSGEITCMSVVRYYCTVLRSATVFVPD